MKNIWAWIIGGVVVVLIIGLLFFGSSTRDAYRIARGAVEQRVKLSQDAISAVANMATAAVDLALKLAGDLPSQQAEADLIKQDIEEISQRLEEVAQARGDLAITRLDTTIELFSKTMDLVEEASNETTDPEVKSLLDRIYGILEATKEQVIQFILNTQE